LAGALGARLGAGQLDRGAPGDRLALGLAVARPLEVALEVALAQRAAASALERVAPAGQRLVLLAARGHRDVGRDADLLDRATRRRVVERGGEAQARAVLERVDGLHRALAEGVLAEHERAALVLERARHDLRGAGAAGVHEHDDRIVPLVAVGARLELLLLAVDAALRVD